MLREARPGDRPYRIGGDEFALLLAHTDSEGARTLARRLAALRRRRRRGQHRRELAARRGSELAAAATLSGTPSAGTPSADTPGAGTPGAQALDAGTPGAQKLRADALRADTLRAEADAALYEAKRQGGDRSAHFEDIRERVVVTSTEQKEAVRALIERGRA